MKNLLIIDHTRHNWTTVFDDIKLANDEELVIEHASPSRINFIAHSSGKIDIKLSPELLPQDNTNQHLHRSFNPDFCLIKKVNPKILYGLFYANIQSLNSVMATYMNQERPMMFGGLANICRRVGFEKFPLISQSFYPDHLQMTTSQKYPLVTKIGAAHAGYGKARIFDRHVYSDIVSIIALHGDYATLEPYFEVEYDYRIQKIGSQYLGFKRTSTNWKANTGSFMLEELKISDNHKFWADQCSELFGGMDILALDVIHTKSGEDYIIELNDSLIGFPNEFLEESLQQIKAIALLRMNELFSQ